MKRPRRAAAIRAVSNLTALEKSNRLTRSRISDGANESEKPAQRTKKRALLASERLSSPRDRKRRRAHFERIVKANFLQNHRLQTSQSTNLSSADTDKQSESPLKVSITAEYAAKILNEPLESLKQSLHALLRQLKSTPNLVEASGTDDSLQLPKAKPKELPKSSELVSLAGQFVSEPFMSHDNSSVRLLVACALAELLRICAPDPPFSEASFSKICNHFIGQLTMLSTPSDGDEALRFSLLEELACVKAMVIFCDVDGVVCDVFACFYAIVQPHQSEKVKHYFLDILVSLLDETEDLNLPILDALVAPLIPTLNYSNEAIRLAESVLRNSSSFIQVPLSSMLNASLRTLRRGDSPPTPQRTSRTRARTHAKSSPGKSSNTGKALSEHHEHIAELIVAINRVSPDVLVYVLPNLEDGLSSKDENVRLGTANLLGRLFSSRADVGHSYLSLFAEFLKRTCDASAEVRMEVTKGLGNLMVFHPKHAEHIDELLRGRMLDRNEEVRCAAVQAVGAAGNNASEELLRVCASRLRDKKVKVRSQAVVAISEILAGGSGSQFTEQKSTRLDSDESPSQDKMEIDGSGNHDDASFAHEARILELSWLPDLLAEALLSVEGSGDFSTATQIENIVFRDLAGIEKSNLASVKPGMRRFFIFLSHLSSAGLSSFSTKLKARFKQRSKTLPLVSPPNKSKQHSQDSVERPGPVAQTSPNDTEDQAATTDTTEVDVGKSIPVIARYLAANFQLFGSKITGYESSLDNIAKNRDVRLRESIQHALGYTSSFPDFRQHVGAIAKSGSLDQTDRDFLCNIVLPTFYPGIFAGPYVTVGAQIAISECQMLQNSEPSEISKAVLRGAIRYLAEICSSCIPESLSFATEGIHDLCKTSITAEDSTCELALCGLTALSRMREEISNDVTVTSILKTIREFAAAKEFVNVKYGALLSKRATQAHLRLVVNRPTERTELGDFAKQLASSFDHFTGELVSILGPVSALSQLAKFSTTAFKPVALESFDFARGLLSGSLNGRILEALHLSDSTPQIRPNQRMTSITSVFGVDAGDLPKHCSDERFLGSALLVHRAVKLLVYSLKYVDDDDIASVVRTLLQIAHDKNGDVFGFCSEVEKISEEKAEKHTVIAESFQAMSAACRMFAGRGVLFIARHPKYYQMVTAKVVGSTILLAQDPSPSVRLSFVRSICQGILRKRLPLRWIIALPLMAIDPDRDNVEKVRSLLKSVFWHRRRLFEHAKKTRSWV